MEILLLFGVFFVLLVLGVPVAVAMMAASIVDIVVMGIPWILAPERMINSINSFPLLAIPFFIFAGVVMNQGGLTRRLVDVSRAFVGHFRGGTAQMNVLASILFSGVSGSSAADAAAIGSILIPTMKKEGYDPGFSVGVTAASSCIGPIIPPSIIMVIYGSMTNLSIGALFLAGILPGIAIGVVQMALVAFYSIRRNYPHRSRLAWKARWRAVWVALPALGAPVIIIGGIVSGFYTPTEAGVIASVYGLFVGLVLYREFRLRDLPMVLVQAVELTAVPVLVLASAGIFGWLLTAHGFGFLVLEALRATGLSSTALLVLIVVMLLFVGLVLEGMAALIIFVPVLMPLVPVFGYDEIHFALIVIITIMIGTVTPPVGLMLYIAASIGQTPIFDVTIWPFVIGMLAVVLGIIVYPPFVTAIPAALLGP